ncbi:Lysine-specific histone demethylase 1A [Elsinoe australis]|uniref:Lysine-specific histone demethylase 1A n=1 Tax=Elsinoe australis TaxID=40998 RepID=A0A2P8AJ79_9PEZI|nr:Lysine-specific histone demethylase 1A [Elsinoe australis]
MQRAIRSNGTSRVCVVGAGVSGLTSAGILISRGFDVTILEARNRIGGRLCQSSTFGPLVDLGANWIHGTESNPIAQLAQEVAAVTSACGTVNSMFDTDGKQLPPKTAGALYEEVWRILDEGYQYSAQQSHSIKSSEKMMDFFREQVAHGQYDVQTQEKLLHIVEMWGAFIGTEWERQGLKFFWLEQGIDGDNLFLASTYQRIVDHLAQPTRTGGNLRLSTEVVHVKHCKTVSGQHAGVLIQTRAGAQEMFDEVVFTTPLGWLKRHQTAFDPPLPGRLAKAVNAIGIGNLDKVYIHFPAAFWISRSDASHRASQDFPIETLFLKPNYAEASNPAHWRQEMLSLASLPAGYSHPILMFYVYGEWGEYITKSVRGMRQDSQEYYDALDKHFQPYYSRLPGYDPYSSDCKPKSYLSSDWQGDEFAGYGSYCNYPTGLEDGARDIEVMREGMGADRGIWFAGEHTAPFPGLGTVAGAYWSGQQVAKDLCKLYGKDVSNIDGDVDGEPKHHPLRGASPVIE